MDKQKREAFNQPFRFEVNGESFQGRALTLGDLMDVQDQFPEWTGLDVRLLLQQRAYRGLLALAWHGMKGCNEGLEEEDLASIITASNFDQWVQPIMRMAGLEAEREDADADPPRVGEASPTGTTS